MSDIEALVVAGGQVPGHDGVRDVRFQNGRVTSVEPDVGRAAQPADRVVDASGCVVLPGLVEAHCHVDKTLFGRPWVPHSARDTLSGRIANERQRRRELGLPDPVAMRDLATTMANNGTTAIRTHTDVDPEVGLAGVEAVATLAAEMHDQVHIQQVLFPQHGLLSFPGTASLLETGMRAGGSVVGGLDPSADGDAATYLDVVFDIAERSTGRVDIHLHSRADPGLREVELILERTHALSFAGRVVVSHAYLFGDLDDKTSRRLADRMAAAGVGVVTTAPYDFPVPPLRILAAAGVTTGVGHDGIRDLWGPYGTGDLLERARHVAYRSGFRSDDDIRLVLDAATHGGRALLGQPPAGPKPGHHADLVVVPAGSSAEALIAAPPRRAVIQAGHLRFDRRDPGRT